MGCCFSKNKCKKIKDDCCRSPKPLKPIIIKEKENKDQNRDDEKIENHLENTITINTYEKDDPNKVNLSILVSEEDELKTDLVTTVLDEDDDRYKNIGKVASRESLL